MQRCVLDLYLDQVLSMGLHEWLQSTADPGLLGVFHGGRVALMRPTVTIQYPTQLGNR